MSEDSIGAILVVDDDEEYLNFMSQALCSAGYTPFLTLSAPLAFQAIKTERFPLIIADLRLAEHSGLDVLAAAQARDPLMVGILMTAYASVDSAVQAMSQGVYDYLLKPCPVDLVVASVRRALDHYRLKRSLLERTAEIERLKRDFSKTSQMIQDFSGQLRSAVSKAHSESSQLASRKPKGSSLEDIQRGLEAICQSTLQMQDLVENLIRAAKTPND